MQQRSRSLRALPVYLVVAFLGRDFCASSAKEAANVSISSLDDVGRVRVTEIHDTETVRSAAVRAILEARFAAASSGRFADRRVLSVTAREGDPSRFDAVVYDYTVEKAFQLLLDAEANELSRVAIEIEPTLDESELADAKRIVAESDPFAAEVASGSVELESVMPPSSSDAKGRRLVNVGIVSRAPSPDGTGANEIVSVHLPTGEVVRYPSGAPASSRANAASCGPAVQTCGMASAICGTSSVVEWPAADPVWKFTVTHPKCTTSTQTDGTGLLLTDVYYKGELILQRAEVPVLNVQYHGNTCGPYRDWLWEEDCFQATGTDVAPGIRVTTGNPQPTTFCETGSDAGNFKGVAIHDMGDYLWLMTENRAGWYRYVMEWKLYLDGTIAPVFGFGATKNSCTCNRHDHHSYWRFEWAIGGTSGDTNTGINKLEHLMPGSDALYTPVTTEGKFVRESATDSVDRWRIQNPQSGTAYVIEPGPIDSTAANDAYANADLWALAYNTAQINDPNAGVTGIRIDSWLNSEALGASKRLVTWYHAGYIHDVAEDGDEPCELVGPRLVPYKMCAGNLGLDKTRYGCSGPVTVTLEDSDLAGTGSSAVSLSSATESTPESVTLVESPVGSGHFSGSIQTTASPATPGDGSVSVVDGDSLQVSYLDGSSCGQSNQTITKTAAIDCAGPSISAVATSNVRGKSAVVSWLTSEPASSVVHYGTTPPGGSTASTAVVVSSHAVLLDGLAECTRYYYWVESTDPQGNTASSNAGGGYFSFTTGKNVAPEYTSHDTPIVIPDNIVTGTTSSVSVGDPDVVQDVNVTVNVTHAYDGDVVLTLTPPGGSGINLVNRRGSYGENFTGTTFDDQASTSIVNGTAPYSGSFKPEVPLTAANGIAASGTWSLLATDLAISDVGTIDSWTLGLTYPAGACAAQTVPPPADGMTAGRLDPAGTTLALSWDVTSCPAPNYHVLYGSLSTLPTYALGGGACGLGFSGSYTWSGVPAGDLWYVIVGDNGGAIESTWGQNGAGQPIGGTTPSGLCGCANRNNTGTCP